MFISYSVTATGPVPNIMKEWAEEWEQYLDAVVLGFTSIAREIERQLKAVCYRERLEPEIGFAFHIGQKCTTVEIFFRIKELDRFLSLNLKPTEWLSFRFDPETKEALVENMENDDEWENMAESRAKNAARYLNADLARNGLPSEMKRGVALIAQFSKIFYQSSAINKWYEVQN